MTCTRNRFVTALPFLLFSLLFFVFETDVARAADIVGRASVIDGDTIEIRGQRLRLHGIDAPESRQLCDDRDQRPYRCGQRAALYLDDLLRGRTVFCDVLDKDRYRRLIVVCRINDDAGRAHDINGILVNQGHALAYRRYSKDYVPLEISAAAAGRGVWQGRFEYPWDWRRRH